MSQAKVQVVLGAQWGDEVKHSLQLEQLIFRVEMLTRRLGQGKGKLVDVLSASADLCCRSAGGNNAGPPSS